ncbi:MAG: S-methyl-5'-thioadenosine phosphorylase [Candidatus Bathyarchaeia archaeon]
MVNEDAEIGIIGGTGVYDPGIFEDVREVKVYTPYGRTSDLVTVGYYKDRKVAFIPRHGRGHQIPPHRINSRANVWAMKELGVKRVIAPSAVGSLREDYRPADFVIVDQFIDRTKARGDTFYEEGRVCHISTADPFCPELRSIFIESAREMAIPFHERGTYICIQGPRFSTRAESRMFRLWGADVIGMTLFPECVLAREMEICYVSVAMITDYDVWAEKPVSVEEILRTMGKNVENFKRLIMDTIPKIPIERGCLCGQALKDATL